MKLKKYLIFALLAIVVLAVIILFANSGSFNMYWAIAWFTVVTTLIYCICKNSIYFWNVAGVAIISGVVYVYAIGWLMIYTCPKVTFVKRDKERVERFYLPTSRTLGHNMISLKGDKSYIMNQTGETLYFSRIAYGDKTPVNKRLIELKNNNVICTKSLGEDYYLWWFMDPRDKIRVSKDVKGKYVVYIDFQPYE